MSHHAKFGTDDDGEFLNFVMPRRYWLTLLPFAPSSTNGLCRTPPFRIHVRADRFRNPAISYHLSMVF